MRPYKSLSLIFAFIISLVCALQYGAWLEREDWRHARNLVIKDLMSKKLKPEYLGPTEIIENENQPLQYGFTYNDQKTRLDYIVHFGGPRGVEMSIWDHERDDND
ncbi:MAG: hypothetical protein J0M22_12205 [Gammaproteobacteria bacterium]|nr:hypothetical protein [Gammaproteobacteria bacterium]